MPLRRRALGPAPAPPPASGVPCFRQTHNRKIRFQRHMAKPDSSLGHLHTPELSPTLPPVCPDQCPILPLNLDMGKPGPPHKQRLGWGTAPAAVS